MVSLLRFVIVVSSIAMVAMCQGVTNKVRPILISDQDENALGAKFKAQILADRTHYPVYTRDSSVIRYVSALGNKIAAAQHDRDPGSFSFTIIDQDSVVNAFSILGGPVFIYTGLLKAAGNGAEVAGVLAHEIGHVTMHHGANQLIQAQGVSVVNQLLFGGDTASASALVAQLVENMTFLRYSRADENQADSCGVAYSSAAGYNAYGVKDFFQILLTKYGDNSFEVFSDHPSTSSRITHVEHLIRKLPHPPAPGSTSGLFTADYLAVRSKI